jgi:hypothetical protein
MEVLGTYVNYFPDLVDEVVERLIDLCEEDDLLVRKTVTMQKSSDHCQIRVRALSWYPVVIDNVPKEIVRLGDVLLQLLSSGKIAQNFY